MPKSITYELKSQFQISDGHGDFEQALTIVCREPHNDVLDEGARIRQWVTQSIVDRREELLAIGAITPKDVEAQEAAARREQDLIDQGLDPETGEDEKEPRDDDDEEEEADPRSFLIMLAQTTIPLNLLYAEVSKIFAKPPNCRINGRRDMTPDIWTKLTLEDTEGVFGKYLQSFFLS